MPAPQEPAVLGAVLLRPEALCPFGRLRHGQGNLGYRRYDLYAEMSQSLLIQRKARVEYFFLGFVWGEPESERSVTENKSLNTEPGVWPIIILKPRSHQASHTVCRVDCGCELCARPGHPQQGTHSRACPEGVLVIGRREI